MFRLFLHLLGRPVRKEEQQQQYRWTGNGRRTSKVSRIPLKKKKKKGKKNWTLLCVNVIVLFKIQRSKVEEEFLFSPDTVSRLIRPTDFDSASTKDKRENNTNIKILLNFKSY